MIPCNLYQKHCLKKKKRKSNYAARPLRNTSTIFFIKLNKISRTVRQYTYIKSSSYDNSKAEGDLSGSKIRVKVVLRDS